MKRCISAPPPRIRAERKARPERMSQMHREKTFMLQPKDSVLKRRAFTLKEKAFGLKGAGLTFEG